MCGIGGIIRTWSRSPPPRAGIPLAWIEAMSSRLAHRGPDGHGKFIDRIRRHDGAVVDVALVHRRLAVIDPLGGAQPMLVSRHEGLDHLTPDAPPPPTIDDLLAVVFNGCIYNHRTLRAELTAAGRRFRTDHSDTEAIGHAFADSGLKFPSRLEGMFAAALWDRAHGRLVVARDRAGEKPLYLATISGTTPGEGTCLLLASTVPALLAVMRLAGHPVEIDEDRLARWVRFGWDRHPPIRGIDLLAPGHIATTTTDLAGWSGRAYDAPFPARDPAKDITLDELDRMLAAAVRQQLESDVPLGCFLSGGIDSSLVAAYASKARPGLRTFCVRMPDARYDESPHARTVARRLGTRHATLDARGKPAEDLVHLISQAGLPIGDSSLLPTYWVSIAAREHVTVALSGDGGDELFMGYDRYRAVAALRDYGPALRWLPARTLERFHPRSRCHRLGRLATAARHAGYEELLSIFPTPHLARLMPGVDPARTLLSPTGTRITDAARFEFETYLPDDLLRKVDTASMAVALEVRAPMLAASVIRAALRLPERVLTNAGPKGLLRMVARRHLPDSIVNRPKQGFALPIGEWLRADTGGMRSLARDAVGMISSAGEAGIDTRAATSMIDEHAAGRCDHGQRIHMLTVLGIWLRDLSRA
ncbi:MAG: asparagine synthase (glutamine-hydrolyzing) [Phycisphaeraceae bacterium]|nr:asparagine synthase (glutamine-hydrolyzing) [Phycisphaerae bacterium]MBX3391193.1 asparagine synthase (glutamine-hydrolyzing) [Phycisphaeraceae bacterium]